MMNQAHNIRDYNEKLLFAEDIVNYIMNDIFRVPYQVNKSEPYRDVVFRGFNKTMREAVAFLYSQIRICIAEYLRAIDEANSWDERTYLHFATSLATLRINRAFEWKNFLCFCIEVAIIAYKFRIKGLLHAPDLAVHLIFVSLQNKDMFRGGWDTLNIIASRTVMISNASVFTLTPESNDAESSDNEIENMSSERWNSDNNSDNTDFQDVDKCDEFSSGEIKIRSKVQVPEIEDSPALVDDGKQQHIQPNVAGGSNTTEKCRKMSEVQSLRNNFIDCTDLESENLQTSRVSGKDNQLEFVSESKGMTQDNESNINSEKTKICKAHNKSSLSIDKNLDAEHDENFPGSMKQITPDSSLIFKETEINSAAQCNSKHASRGSYQLHSPSTSIAKSIISNVTDTETVNNMQTEGQKEFPVRISSSSKNNKPNSHETIENCSENK